MLKRRAIKMADTDNISILVLKKQKVVQDEMIQKDQAKSIHKLKGLIS